MDSIASALEQVSPSFSGQLLRPSDAGYGEARRVHNGLVDKRPAVIARCLGTADIAEAVRLAATLELEVAIRGGGHNVAGMGTVEGGVMIDLSLMRGIFVDASARTVIAQGGVLWRELNRETQVHALATTGGVVSTTGIAGLTLGGGIGWLMPKYGLALDNLKSAEIVLADAQVVRVDADQNTDLFWAIRGGGGNFGVAASLEYRLHPVGPIITGGLVAHPLQQGAELFKRFRERCESAPDELMLVAGVLTSPDGTGAKLAAIAAAHCGSLAEGESAVRSIKAFGSPVLDTMGPIPYCDQNRLLDESFPRGALNYWKAQFLSELSDEAIKTLIECYEANPSPMSQIVIEHFHGEASRVSVEYTSCAMRLSGYNVAIVSQWSDPTLNDTCISWCRETFAALKPFLGPMRYVNYLGTDEGDDPAAVVYGTNYARLRDIKRKYDPENVFHLNVNIKPADS